MKAVTSGPRKIQAFPYQIPNCKFDVDVHVARQGMGWVLSTIVSVVKWVVGFK